MGSDPDIAKWIQSVIERSETSTTISEGLDSSAQARRLLEKWTEQSDTFKTASSPKQARTVKYRRLDAPMLVAPKAVPQKVVDRNEQKEATKREVHERVRKRMEKIAQRQPQEPTIPRPIELPIEIPNVEAKIAARRSEIDEKLRQKQKDLDDKKRRSIRMRAIEESAKRTIANEEKRMREELDARVQEEETEMEKNLATSIVLLHRIVKTKLLKQFFGVWIDRCSFHTKLYERAAAFDSFRRKSRAFVSWKRKADSKIEQRNIKEMEKRMRRERRLEETADRFYKMRHISGGFIRWKALFKAHVEKRISEELHRQRKEKLQQAQLERAQLESPPKDTSPPRKKPKPKQGPDPRSEEIAKKLEEQRKLAEEIRKKRIEDAQQVAQLAAEIEARRIQEDLEQQRLKKAQHRKFLAEEKKKRDEQKKQQEEFKRQVERRKYIEKASTDFCTKQIKQRALQSWIRLIILRDRNEERAEVHARQSLMAKAFHSLNANRIAVQAEKERRAQQFFNDNIKRTILLGWFAVHQDFLMQSDAVVAATEKWMMHKCMNHFIMAYKAKRRDKYNSAIRFANASLMRLALRAWPLGCSAMKDDAEREKRRQGMLARAKFIMAQLTDSDDDSD